MSVAASSEVSVSSQQTSQECSDVARWGLVSRLAARTILRSLRRLQRGRLDIRCGCEQAAFGDLNMSELLAVVNVRRPDFFSKLLLRGGIGGAESYMDGDWESPDLTAVFRVLLQNEDVFAGFRPARFGLAGVMQKIQHLRNRNSRSGSQRNIHQHYDLGNEFFSLFLDESMMYSSAIFPSPQASLADASWEKVDRVCRTLRLSANTHVLEIGTGWGGFALHAASKYGCRVTTTTISEQQYRYASQRIADAGLSDRVTVLRQDYRDLQGKYDRLVSLEMIEAVGREYLPGYFRTCDRLLKDDGAMMLQAIVMPEQRFEAYERNVDFIQKYIFPGGFLPSITLMQDCIRRNSNLRMLTLDDYGHHYAATLRHWNERFHDRLPDVSAQGFSERFIRMWRYYLCYCEAAFLERAIGLVQTVWARPACELGTDVTSPTVSNSLPGN